MIPDDRIPLTFDAIQHAGTREKAVRSARLMRATERHVLIACSGGADSTLLAWIAACDGLDASLMHVNHHLSGMATAFEDAVTALAEGLDLPLHLANLDPEEIHALGTGIEAGARVLRYRALAEAAAVEGAVVTTGHTADDRLESAVMQLATGGSLLASAGPLLRTEIEGATVLRPLRGWWRDEIEATLAEIGISAVDDPMNADHRYLRSRVRAESIPAIKAAGSQAAVLQALDQAELDAQALNELAAERFAALARLAPDTVTFATGALRGLSEGLRLMMLREGARQLGCRRGVRQALTTAAAAIGAGRPATAHGHRLHVTVDRAQTCLRAAPDPRALDHADEL